MLTWHLIALSSERCSSGGDSRNNSISICLSKYLHTTCETTVLQYQQYHLWDNSVAVSTTTSVRHQVAAVRHQVAAVRHQVAAVRHQVAAVRHQVAAVRHQVAAVRHQVAAVRHQIAAAAGGSTRSESGRETAREDQF